MKCQKLLPVIAAATMLVSCGAESRTLLGYEQPVCTLVTATQYSDTVSYLDCFTPEAKAAYKKSDDYNIHLAEIFTMHKDGEIPDLTYSVLSRKDLTKDEVVKLKSEYKSKYKKVIDFTKAMSLKVSIKYKNNEKTNADTRELTVVRANDSWLIYGDVITSFTFGQG